MAFAANCGSWYTKLPKPPRRTVLPFPRRSQANPARGAQYSALVAQPASGTLESRWFQLTPGNVAGSAVLLYCEGTHVATPIPLRAVHGCMCCTRSPYSSVRRRFTFQLSCAKKESSFQPISRTIALVFSPQLSSEPRTMSARILLDVFPCQV